ncbi:Uncharacterized protein HZ326_14466 [Fusarium oxysporum f. sp. albedinis]|nr:Uncharacterized protein HZ326_14466 [Fusarium oxysporum f. sp. albedinis]
MSCFGPSPHRLASSSGQVTIPYLVFVRGTVLSRLGTVGTVAVKILVPGRPSRKKEPSIPCALWQNSPSRSEDHCPQSQARERPPSPSHHVDHVAQYDMTE